MRYVSAYLLARLGGNDSPSASDVEKILGSVGIDCDNERLSKVISELDGKDVDELIKQGLTKLASVPSGGAVASGGAAAAAGGSAEPEKKEEKPAEKEEEEESDDDMGFGLFD